MRNMITAAGVAGVSAVVGGCTPDITGTTDALDQTITPAATCAATAVADISNEVGFSPTECDASGWDQKGNDEISFCEAIYRDQVYSEIADSITALTALRDELDQNQDKTFEATDRANLIADLYALLQVDATLISNVP